MYDVHTTRSSQPSERTAPMPDQSSRPRPRAGRAWVSLDPSAAAEPRRPSLTRPRVVRAALRLVDEKGRDALTMRALASELQVSTMALYNHVHDKDELVDLMVDLMLGEVDCTPGPDTEDWATQLRNLYLHGRLPPDGRSRRPRVLRAPPRTNPHNRGTRPAPPRHPPPRRVRIRPRHP